METEFINAQDMAMENPDTFYAPSQEELDEIRIGKNVKVSTGGERFWVIVKSKCGEDLTGIVNNDLINTDEHGLNCGDFIIFNTYHVYDIL